MCAVSVHVFVLCSRCASCVHVHAWVHDCRWRPTTRNSQTLARALTHARAQDATSKGREIFRILVNTLALSKTLCQVSGANDQEVIKTEQVSSALPAAIDAISIRLHTV